MKQEVPALPDSPTFRQLWDALGSRFIETTQGHMPYTRTSRFETCTACSNLKLPNISMIAL